jgi:retron-type reverse transcriptase
MGGKILDKLLINRINHHLYKKDLLSERQYGFTPQRNTIDAAMEAKSFIQPIHENRGLVIMTSLDVQKTFDSASWPAILQGLRDVNCSRNLYILSKEFFSNRKAVINTKNFTIERHITKGRLQGSCSGPEFWNILYNSLLTLELNSRSRSIAFADDLIILTRDDTVTEAENFMNLALIKVQKWAQNNRLGFNDDKSKVMILTRKKRKEKKEIAVFINK